MQKKIKDDTISRQEAIRIVDGIDTWQAGWRGDAIESMKALPSAQTEQKWIPCSERLPDKSGKYLATAFEGTVKKTTIVLCQSRCRLWSLTGRRTYWKVIAWMPLPEAYREEGDS